MQANLRLGNYPLPLAEAGRIRQWLEFPLSATVALDPCVGEGTAFAIIAADQAVLRCGIELDAYRAEKALAVCGHVIQGDALETVCPSESVSLLYENPPYLNRGLPQHKSIEKGGRQCLAVQTLVQRLAAATAAW